MEDEGHFRRDAQANAQRRQVIEAGHGEVGDDEIRHAFAELTQQLVLRAHSRSGEDHARRSQLQLRQLDVLRAVIDEDNVILPGHTEPAWRGREMNAEVNCVTHHVDQ